MCRLSYAFRCVLVGVVLLGLAASVLAQVGRVNGTVTDENGDPIPGAQVRAENPSARPPVIEMAVDEDPDESPNSDSMIQADDWQ